ncbi:MAG: protein kinase domain-containing protein [Candidatus Xenobia bacterium]
MLSSGVTLQGRYTIVGKLGEGGMGTVWLAREKSLHQKPVAVKVLQQDLQGSPQAAREFEKEALMLSRVSHPGLVEVTDYFIEDGHPHLVMSYIEGRNLLQIMERSPRLLDVSRVVDWTLQVCDVLEYLHAQQPPIIVRDLKPSNLMLTAGNRVVLIDFGLARWHDATRTSTWLSNVGSPGFAPPEEYGFGSTDPRTDIYALGATLHMLLTRQRPPTALDMATGSRTRRAASRVNPAVPPALDGVIARAMAVRRADRYQSVTELREALQGLHARDVAAPPPAGGRTPVLLPLLLVAGLIVSLIALRPGVVQPLPLHLLDRVPGVAAAAGRGDEIAVAASDGLHLYPGARHLADSPESAVAIGGDGQMVATGYDYTEGSVVRLWELRSGRLEQTLHGAQGSVVALHFDATRIMAGTTCGFTVWRCGDGARLLDISTTADAYAPTHVSGNGTASQPGAPVAFSPDGHLGAWATHFDVGLWDLQTGRRIALFPYPRSFVSCIGFAPDSTHLWLGTADGSVHRLDVRNGSEDVVLPAHTHQVEALAVLQDGRLLTAGVDRRVRLWDVARGRCLAETTVREMVSSISVNQDGRHALLTTVSTIQEWGP